MYVIGPEEERYEKCFTITLSKEQVELANEEGPKWVESYKDTGGATPIKDDHEDENIKGILGEMALATAYDAEIDLSVYKHGDGGVDMFIQGTAVDSKTRQANRPHLLCKEGKVEAEVFMLCQIDPDEDLYKYPKDVEILGYCTHDEIMSQPLTYFPGEHHEKRGGKMNRVIYWADLTPPPDPINVSTGVLDT